MSNHDARSRLTLRHVALAGVAFATLAVVGGTELDSAGATRPLPRHNITGFAATPSCDNKGGTPSSVIDWTFTSSNATGHTITTVSFNRAVVSSSHTASTVSARTKDQPGPATLVVSVVWEDGHHSSFAASTVMVEGLCPAPVTTTIGTPATVVPPSTTPTFAAPVPPLVPLPTTALAPCAPGLHPVNPPADFACVLDAPPVFHSDTPTSVVQGPPRAGTALPVTGSSSSPMALAGVVLLVVAGALLLAGRRGSAA